MKSRGVGRKRPAPLLLTWHHWSLQKHSLREVPMVSASIPSILQDHVALTVRCVDRLYLNGYLPTLQTSGQLVHFLHDHLGNPIPSPALFRPLHDRFVGSIQCFAEEHQIPI